MSLRIKFDGRPLRGRRAAHARRHHGHHRGAPGQGDGGRGSCSRPERPIRRIPVGRSVVDAILTLVRQGRPESSEIEEVRRQVAWGPGPRASQALMLATRARAVLEGRLAPSVDDVLALAGAVLRHRMASNFSARADGVTIDQVVERLAAPLA